MKKPSRLDYAYAVGRVRALENNLISRAVLKEAADEKDFADTMKALFDAGKFSEGMTQITTSLELDEFLEKEEKGFFNLIEKILLEKDILKIIFEAGFSGEKITVAENTGYPFIKKYFQHKVDLCNLKVFIRVKYSGFPKETLEAQLLDGGFLDKHTLLKSFELSFSEAGEKLQATDYRDFWGEAIDALLNRETFVALERGMNDFLTAYLKRAKYIVFGPEPVFAYALARQKEFDFVRFLGVGKLNRIPAEILKQRMGETYV
ncbi:V-type ATPase subunit [Acidobacteriota bacterium]